MLSSGSCGGSVACMASHKKQLLGPIFSELDHVICAVYTVTYRVQSMNPLYLLSTIYLNCTDSLKVSEARGKVGMPDVQNKALIVVKSNIYIPEESF